MSFVYIDSQDREVNIPSVDAVRLRIELGAIKDQTRFFDSNTGKWAPAAEHEIYRTLKRQLMEAGQGFVAPPPPSMGSDSSSGRMEPSLAGTARSETVDPGPGESTGPEGDTGDFEGVAELYGSIESDEPAGADSSVEADESEAAGELGGPSEDEESGEPEELEGFGSVELMPTDEGLGTHDESKEDADPEDLWGSDEPDQKRPGTPVEADADGGEAASEEESFVTSTEDELLGAFAGDPSTSTLDDQGLELEPKLADSFTGADPGTFGAQDADGSEGGLFGGSSSSEIDAGWDQEPNDDGDAPREGGPAEDAFGEVWEDPEDHRFEPSALPDDAPDTFGDSEPSFEEEIAAMGAGVAPPQRRLTRARTPGAERIVGMVALVAALGAVVFFGWPFLAPTLGSLSSGEPEIFMPPLDQDLFPRMRQLAGRASERMAQDMLALPERSAVPEEPSEDWLAGIYLASASDYPNVPGYWSALRDWVEVSQRSENALFREALRAQLDTANLAASDSEAIRDRALAGFQAAGSDRRIVYEQMREVAERSVELHEFLLANEDQITHEPAETGVSRDPVREAVPSSGALGDEMWERVASITNAMDALGYLDRIDTERLVGVFLEKLEATAIR